METELTNQQREQFLADHGLTIEARFIPWNQSRNRDEKTPSLNWKVTLKRNGRDILTCDYSAGYGHCKSKPENSAKSATSYAYKAKDWNQVIRECNGEIPRYRKDPKSLPLDVWYSILLDASAIDSPTYEDWASDLGYDPDSRSGEKIYRTCLEYGLKLRAALGDSLLNELREAFQGY